MRKKDEFVHTKEHQRPAIWKRCVHLAKCECPDKTTFKEECQTCGKPAKYAMVFAGTDLRLFTCEKCK